MDYSDITVIIPTLNEEKNISHLLRTLTSLYPRIGIIISDDGSSDGTKKIVADLHKKNKRILFLDRGKKHVHGLTASVLDGLILTKNKFAIVMDGDMQHPPEKVGELARKLRGGADIVVGIRSGKIENWPAHRQVVSIGATWLGKIRLWLKGKNSSDILSGFFGIRTELAKRIISEKRHKFEERGYKVLFEILKLLTKRHKLAEVPYKFGMRGGGTSKIRFKHIFIYAKSLLK